MPALLRPSPHLLSRPPPIHCSLRDNHIGVEGTSALAAILKETKITELECAAASQVFAFLSAPIDTT